MSALKEKRWLRSIFLYFLAFVAGASGAAFGLSVYNARALSAITDYELAEQENRAVTAFRTLNPDTAIYAQENLIRYLEIRKKVGWIDEKYALRVSGVAKIRIALVLSSLNKKHEANDYYEQGSSDLKNSDMNIQNHVELDRLTENLRKERIYSVK